MISENLSPIPASVVYDELRTWVDGNTTGTFLFNRTGDILYQHRSGAQTLPQMPNGLAKAVISGKAQLMIGTCAVYGALSPSDHRRWEVRALYSYQPHDELPVVQYLQEADITETAKRCDASTLRSEWLSGAISLSGQAAKKDMSSLILKRASLPAHLASGTTMTSTCLPMASWLAAS
jgi:hypothetical protein